MKLDPNAPAWPQKVTIHGPAKSAITGKEIPEGHVEDNYLSGLTIRAELAARMMAGIASNPALQRSFAKSANSESALIAKMSAVYAVEMADALIAELNREEGK